MGPVAYSYNEAINPHKYIICAMELRPFSLGHYVILEQVKSPFISSDPDNAIGMEDGSAHFLFCLLICSLTFEECLKVLDDRKLFLKLIKKVEKNLLKSMKKDRDWNLFYKVGMFKEYIRFFTEMPVFQVEENSPSVPSGIDWKQNLFTIARNEWGYTDSEILNMPMRRLFFEWCSYAEKNGAIRVQNADELELLKAIKK